MVSVSKIKYIQLGELRLQITANLGKEASEAEVIVRDFHRLNKRALSDRLLVFGAIELIDSRNGKPDDLIKRFSMK